MAPGMAATMAGGDILFVEASVVPGKGRLILTGKLGEVMQESAQAAVTYARMRGPELQHRPRLLRAKRHPHPRASGGHPQGRPIGGGDHRHRPGLGHNPPAGA